jgi:GxxExxY protein
MTGNDLTGMLIDAAMHIHRTLGPGLLESVYSAILAYELKKRGLRVASEVPIPVQWDNLTIDVGFRADLIVEDEVIVELKSVEKTAAVHKKQLLTYLRVTNKRVGLLINFGEVLLKDGITRMINGFDEES